ncbi:glycosyltransferase [Frateuria hangzhouensis]|uniref:glycosyltransferase n=1 Tax=Frateuria hangzhouensis TaxID=2995589 RepID=UPI002260B919|nr:glycosyltransferase [Frateuria sp. STR12]MCX7515185.1 glycosyltransferase [Frateuria sp. STR12]
MRILYHHRTQGRQVEGVHIRGIVHALRDLGHEVEILSFPGADPEQEPQQASASAKPGRFGPLLARAPGVLFELLELGYNLVTLFRVGRTLRRLQPQMIYERYALFLFVTVWLARRRGIPVILEINDSALVPRVRSLTLRRLARRIERWCLRQATGLVFISHWFHDTAREAYGDIAPAVISPNAADLQRFDPARFDRDALRRERGLEGRVVCGYVGAFVPWHGIAAFVRAIVSRLHATPHLTLLLVGDGVDLPAVAAAIEAAGMQDRVRLPGRVAHAEVAAWIACMDYAVLADSNEYGSPMKLFELMAMEVAVVAPDYAPIAEVVTDGADGWLFARGQVDACAGLVLKLAQQPDDLRRAGAAARANIVAHHQWRNNAGQLLSLLPAKAPTP